MLKILEDAVLDIHDVGDEDIDLAHNMRSLVHHVASLGPTYFSNDVADTLTVKTNKHIVVIPFATVDDGSISEDGLPLQGYNEGITDILDMALLDYPDEAVQHLLMMIPTDSMVSLIGWDSAGAALSVGLSLVSVPLPGIMVSAAHGHLPRLVIEGAYDIVDDMACTTGRHLWGAAWAPEVAPGDRC